MYSRKRAPRHEEGGKIKEAEAVEEEEEEEEKDHGGDVT
jgi:hypothetical protein